MGLSASQARFLQLTARKSDIEYQAQQISQERLSLAQQLTQASNDYNDAISNKKLVFTYADSTTHTVDVTYNNYKNYMNQQMAGLSSSQTQIFLVSSSGNKIVVANEEDMNTIIEQNTTYVAKSEVDAAQSATDPTDAQKKLLETDWSNCAVIKKTVDNQEVEYYVQSQKYAASDFMIVDGLDDVDLFQDSIRNGVYFFATYGQDDDNKDKLMPQDWTTVATAAVTEVYDESDDAEAEAVYENITNRLELYDKKLQLGLDQLETERDAIQTEMESVTQVMNDNIEKTFDTFS